VSSRQNLGVVAAVGILYAVFIVSMVATRLHKTRTSHYFLAQVKDKK
jgi:hypothetical protein